MTTTKKPDEVEHLLKVLANTLLAVFSLMALIFLAAITIRLTGGYGPNDYTGTAYGTLSDLRKGSSWYGALELGGTTTTGGKHSRTVPRMLYFCVPLSDEVLVKQLQDAAASGKRIRLDYHRWILPPWEFEDHNQASACAPAEGNEP